MKNLVSVVNGLKKDKDVSRQVNQRIHEFKHNNDWFSELCYCIMTANARADKAIEMQKTTNFYISSQSRLAQKFKGKIRFHNNKAKYICKAKEYRNIRQVLEDKDDYEARNWLVQNIKGLGMKEASHFLRNVGYENLAILDRHILSVLKQYHIIRKIPTLTKKSYFVIESKMIEIARATKLTLSALDLYLWYMKTGKVLK